MAGDVIVGWIDPDGIYTCAAHTVNQNGCVAVFRERQCPICLEAVYTSAGESASLLDDESSLAYFNRYIAGDR